VNIEKHEFPDFAHKQKVASINTFQTAYPNRITPVTSDVPFFGSEKAGTIAAKRAWSPSINIDFNGIAHLLN
jgi:hypothetical protein